MKNRIMFSVLCLLLGMTFAGGSAFAADGESGAANEATSKAAPTAAANAGGQAAAEAEEAALKAEVDKIFGRNDWLGATSSSENSTVEFAQSNSFFCNQGARCTFKTDPVCGSEGFCNLPSRCCMCH